jgi:hypothetical protein
VQTDLFLVYDIFIYFFLHGFVVVCNWVSSLRVFDVVNSAIIFQHPVTFKVTHVCSLPFLMQLCFSWFL